MDLAVFKKVNQLKQELDTLRPISPEIERRVMQKFRLDCNYHSNHIEGNTLTFGETKALILYGLTAQTKPLRDHFEITGHNEAVLWLEEVIKQNRPLNEAFIRELHVLLLKENTTKKAKTPDGQIITRTIEVGKYKSSPNHVETASGDMFYFASPEETPAKMNDLMNWYNEQRKSEDTNPILFATQFHYDFIRIHPFDDGNGRTARLLMNFVLMSYGFPPVIIKTQDKVQYFNVLQAADAGNIEPFVIFVAENLSHSLDLMIKAANGEEIEEIEDVYKELSLLKGKLKEMGDREIPLRNDLLLSGVLEKTIIPFIHRLEKALVPFHNFYHHHYWEFKGNHSSKVYDSIDFLNTIEKKTDLGNLNIKLSHSVFKYENFDDFSYYDEIEIKFSQSRYKFYINRSNNVFLEKYYDEQLTEAEMDLIVQTIVKKHKDAIQQLLEKK